MNPRLAALASVLRSGRLRRIEAAFLLFSVGEWSTWLAIVVYAYRRGGAAEAGLVAFVQLVPSIVLAPVASALGDRLPRSRVLVGTYLVQAIAMAGAAAALLVDAPSLVVYVLATLTATTVTLTRPVQAALLPEVVGTPEELTAANVASGAVEGFGALLGPVLAGVLLAVAGPGLVFVATSIALAVATIAVVPLARGAAVPAGTESGGAGPGVPGGAVTPEIAAGIGAIAGDRRLRGVVGLVGVAFFLLGALDIFYAVLAIDILGADDSAVGFLGAATGVGAVAGSAGAVALVGRERLGLALMLSVLGFGASIAAIGLVAVPLVAPLCLAAAGAGAALAYIAGQTLIQRIAPDAVLSRVFGVLEGLMMACTALGAISVPLLVSTFGPRGAFVAAGAALSIAVVVLGRNVLAIDAGPLVPLRELRLLRAIPMFAPLSAPVVERLAGALVPIHVPAGQFVIREGDRGDRFYILVSGRAEVTQAGTPVRAEGPGDYFGEIALLRDVPRTASVRATADLELLALEREPFLEAITGQPRSRDAADAVVSRRLGETG